MKAELAKIKQENSDMHHREAFKIAAARWAESTENPKNQKGGIAKAATEGEQNGAENAAKTEESAEAEPQDGPEEASENAPVEDQKEEPVQEPAEAASEEQPAAEE